VCGPCSNEFGKKGLICDVIMHICVVSGGKYSTRQGINSAAPHRGLNVRACVRACVAEGGGLALR
jgi:hypothetical protein